ncbi:MAG: helix-turn-helix domain-containing protein [Bradymonadaceae bacterium]
MRRRDADWEALGALVRQKRKDKDIGLREFAESLDKSHAFVSRFERGKSTASRETLKSIAIRLELSTPEVYGALGVWPPRVRPKSEAEIRKVIRLLREHRED